MVELRLILAADCPKIATNRMMDLCSVIFPDRIVQCRSRWRGAPASEAASGLYPRSRPRAVP